MKFLRYILLLASATSLLFAAACSSSDDPELTTGQKMSKTWVITSGAPVDATGFEITFTTDDAGLPATYSVTPAGLDGLGMKPNYYSTTNSGSWEFNASETEITFEAGGAGESVVSVSGISETTLTLSWTAPKDLDKTAEEPYTYQLSPKN
ncbi:hypothetical protein R9C00_02710 [Flammeovirgaceae bacterium SG7u.111]|nr:hypothetical protein [Flammeovirgaceae bacterium SG7u.132]WPO36351.1 hypothetical protein R9C00_02710 [Flammeovirgaceae bacterium SG7u.111]